LADRAPYDFQIYAYRILQSALARRSSPGAVTTEQRPRQSKAKQSTAGNFALFRATGSDGDGVFSCRQHDMTLLTAADTSRGSGIIMALSSARVVLGSKIPIGLRLELFIEQMTDAERSLFGVLAELSRMTSYVQYST
jgi:hypothetical protein